MRISISGKGGKKLPKWRATAKKRLRILPGSISREIRQCVAENMEREALKRAFKELGQKHKTDFRKQEENYFEAKKAAILEWSQDELADEKLDDFQITEMANRATLAKAGHKGKEAVRARYRAVKWKTVKVGGKPRRIPTHYRLLVVRGNRTVMAGAKVEARIIKLKMAGKAYWDRLRALAAALAITKKDGSFDLLRARKIDRKMMNVPDNVRRKIYDECVEKAASGYIGPSHLFGVDTLPASRKEMRERWGNVVARHGDKKGQSSSRHSRRTRGRGGNPRH